MASTQINYTQGTPTDGIKYTLSMWAKRSNNGADSNYLASVWVDGSNHWCMRFITDQLDIYDNVGGSTTTEIKTTRKFRDPGAWYHIVYVYDSANVTAGDRQRLYVNGVEETIFDVDTNPSSSYASILNVSGRDLTFGARNSASYWDGCMSHINFCDGQAYTASDFGETDATTGMWKIKTSPSVTYGNNGFFLKMEDSSNLDLDSSGNSQSFTTTGTLTATKDNPDNNFATLNPLSHYYTEVPTLSNGNTVVTDSTDSWCGSTMGFDTGKYYWEIKVTGGVECVVGVLKQGVTNYDGTGWLGVSVTGVYGFNAYSGAKITDGTSASYDSAISATNVINVAMDATAGSLYIGVNGTWLQSSNPSTSTSPMISSMGTDSMWVPFSTVSTTGGDTFNNYNFGNGVFGTTSITDAGTNASNNGLFEYDVPTGYTALSTKGLNS